MQAWQRQNIFNAGFDVIYVEAFAVLSYHTNGWVLLSLCCADTVLIAMQPTIASILGKEMCDISNNSTMCGSDIYFHLRNERTPSPRAISDVERKKIEFFHSRYCRKLIPSEH